MSLSPEYLVLFQAVEDAQKELESLTIRLNTLRQRLIRAQQDAEEAYISREDPEDPA